MGEVLVMTGIFTALVTLTQEILSNSEISETDRLELLTLLSGFQEKVLKLQLDTYLNQTETDFHRSLGLKETPKSSSPSSS